MTSTSIRSMIHYTGRKSNQLSKPGHLSRSNLETVLSDPNDPSNDSYFHHLVENSDSKIFKPNHERIYFISQKKVIENIKKLRSSGDPILYSFFLISSFKEFFKSYQVKQI